MESRELARLQLDHRLHGFRVAPSPVGGWIRTIRQALGMTMAQLGRRLGVSAPAIAALEGSEARGAISLARLSNAAEAMGCDLVVTFVPRVPLTEMVRQQAMRKARQDQDRLLHTMRLEGQEAGVGSPEAIDRSAARWMEGRPARLWD